MGDIWSIGIIAYILVTGVAPFMGKDYQSTVVAIMTKTIKWPKSIKISDNCKDFISKCLEKSVKKRWNAKEALRHEWLNPANASHSHLGNQYMDNLVKFDERMCLFFFFCLLCVSIVCCV